MRQAGHVAHSGEWTGALKAFVGKPEGKRPLGRPMHGWEDNTEVDLQEMGCGGWTELILIGIETDGKLLQLQ